MALPVAEIVKPRAERDILSAIWSTLEDEARKVQNEANQALKAGQRGIAKELALKADCYREAARVVLANKLDAVTYTPPEETDE